MMMPRSIAALIAATSLGAIPPSALAGPEGAAAVEAGLQLALLLTVEATALIGGVVVAIGSAVDLTRSSRSHGWWITSMIFGALNTVLGAITTIVLARNCSAELGDCFSHGWWVFSAVPLAVGVVDVSLGSINLARPVRSPEVDPIPETAASQRASALQLTVRF